MISSEMIDIIGPALAAGLLIVFTHAPLGINVLERGIIFIDLAVAQIAGLGLVAVSTFIHEPALWLIQLVALVCAALAALFFRFMEIAMPEQQEAVIGVCFVLAASLAVLLLADQPHGGEEIQHLLSGQILFITWYDVLIHAPIYAFILAVWFIKPAIQRGIGFYLLFALAITSSVQLVGVYVVFSSLILPALAAVGSKHPYMKAWVCGVVSVVIGIIVAMLTDLPAGPILVCILVISSALMCRITVKNISS